MSTFEVTDNTYILDLRDRIFEARVDGGSLVLNEAVPSGSRRPVNLEITFDPEMLRVLLKRIAANEAPGARRVHLEQTPGYCSVCGRTAEQDPSGTWTHLEYSCESPKARFTTTPPSVENPNDIKVALNDLVSKMKPLRPAMSPTLRSILDKVEEWSKS